MDNNKEETLKYAMEYASSSNALENNGLTAEEIKKIHEDIVTGKKDESFLYSLIDYMKKKNPEPEQQGEKSALQR